MRPNWFFAFPVDGGILAHLPELPAALRRYHPDDVHLTLSFLGGCGETAALRALDVLDARLLAAPEAPLAISLGAVAPMGGSKLNYSALSALLEDGREATVACLLRLRDPLLEAAAGRREKRAPKPHVTLARPRRRAGERERAEGLAWAERVELRGARAVLDRIALYTWSADRRERLFQIVAERRLKASPE
jgi:2'-5' RNA ligase